MAKALSSLMTVLLVTAVIYAVAPWFVLGIVRAVTRAFLWLLLGGGAS